MRVIIRICMQSTDTAAEPHPGCSGMASVPSHTNMSTPAPVPPAPPAAGLVAAPALPIRRTASTWGAERTH